MVTGNISTTDNVIVVILDSRCCGLWPAIMIAGEIFTVTSLAASLHQRLTVQDYLLILGISHFGKLHYPPKQTLQLSCSLRHTRSE